MILILSLVIGIIPFILNVPRTSSLVISDDKENTSVVLQTQQSDRNILIGFHDRSKENDLVNTRRINVDKSCEQTWMYYSNGTCHYGGDVHGTVKCSTNPDRVSILKCSCMTYDDKEGVAAAICPYGYGHWNYNKTSLIWSYDPDYYVLPNNVSKLNNAMCGQLKRDGLLCSKCRDGLSPLVYSYDLNCIKCTNSRYNWLKFIAVAFIPLTIFYFIVILFRINATDPYLYIFITFNQVLTSPINLRVVLLTLEGISTFTYAARVLVLPMTIWNLDFFRSLPLNICLNISMLQTLTLDYAIALYPLILVIITYALVQLHARGCRLIIWLWRPFHKCCSRFSRIVDIRSSLIKAFATFLHLSYVKLLNSTLDVLLPTVVYNVHQEVVGVYVYYDASYKYFSKEHIPYAAMSILLFLIFIVSPLILLLLYPTSCCQKCLNLCGRRNLVLYTFVDAFQGHFKDGTEPGTRDCRWFAAVYFLGRIIIIYAVFVISNYVRSYTSAGLAYMLGGLSMLFLIMLMILLQPYKSRTVNTYHIVGMLVIIINCFLAALVAQGKVHWIANTGSILIGLLSNSPILFVIGYAIYYRTSCRSFKRYWLRLPQNDRDPELENLLETNSRE